MHSGGVDFDHPANAAVLRRFTRGTRGREAAPDLAPDEVADLWALGTHPDLMYDFWNKLTEGMADAARCQRVVYGTPALVSPVTGVIFGFAGGTHTIAFRLPPAERERVLAAGGTRVLHFQAYPDLGVPASTDTLADLEEAWVFCNGVGDTKRWCHAARAFADAGG